MGEVFALAIGIAASLFPVIPAILPLFTTRPRLPVSTSVSADWTTADVVGVVVPFTAVASISVAVPVVLYAVAGERVLPPLERAKAWLLRNNAAVMAVVVTVIGLVLLKNGVSGL